MVLGQDILKGGVEYVLDGFFSFFFFLFSFSFFFFLFFIIFFFFLFQVGGGVGESRYLYVGRGEGVSVLVVVASRQLCTITTLQIPTRSSSPPTCSRGCIGTVGTLFVLWELREKKKEQVPYFFPIFYLFFSHFFSPPFSFYYRVSIHTVFHKISQGTLYLNLGINADGLSTRSGNENWGHLKDQQP